MDFEWDDAKSETTLRDRGFRFEIIESFDWQFAICVDIQVHDGEERELWIGPIEDHLYVVVLTMVGKTARIISLRRASQNEIEIWRREYHG